MSRRSWLPRPQRAALPLLASAAVLAVWSAVARGSGVGWVQSVGALVAGILAVGLVGPAIAASRLRCHVESAPTDAVAGSAMVLRATVRGTGIVHPAWPPGPAVPTGRSAEVTLRLEPAHRGVLEHCTVVVSSAAPFGILWWARAIEVPLPHPVLVAPRTGPPDPQVVDLGAGCADQSAAGGAGSSGALRGVRPYVPGDRPTSVHWPATAHTGTLVVRDHERPADRSAFVRGTLTGDASVAEAQAERVLGTVAALLASGLVVRLATVEPDGEVVGIVPTTRRAGRRLALAVPRRPFDPAPSRRARRGRSR